jgi:hypothetical protein
MKAIVPMTQGSVVIINSQVRTMNYNQPISINDGTEKTEGIWINKYSTCMKLFRWPLARY